MADEVKDQMSLFGALQEMPKKESIEKAVNDKHPVRSTKQARRGDVSSGQLKKAAPKTGKGGPVRGGRNKVPKPQAKTYAAGLVPAGDVRLTINIRQDLHLRLKIAAAHERSTIGEIIEELVEQYVPR